MTRCLPFLGHEDFAENTFLASGDACLFLRLNHFGSGGIPFHPGLCDTTDVHA